MGLVEFDLQRAVRAPIVVVFARLADIDGYNGWMPQKGSLLRRTQQTSPGPPAMGTTFLDETTTGPTPAHHHARMHTHGIYRPATPFLRRVAMRERSVTLAALAESFEGG